mmetsp:Transcript_12550/g.1878  ORF Transcript_12550/g.1878 Transcript_12550/m.1878 type:complete len:93 (-) Transcript_12550:1378-1656(-)
MARSVSVKSEMVIRLIQELKKQGFECIVSPFEADAQLAFLTKIGYVDAAISEDSDLLPFGCKNVLYKYQFSGNFQLIKLDSLKTHPLMNFKQ